MAHGVVLDTCVLYPMYLRDTLLRLGARDLYSPVWTADILGELHNALIREQATTQDQADRILGLMRANFSGS